LICFYTNQGIVFFSDIHIKVNVKDFVGGYFEQARKKLGAMKPRFN